jgi:diaminohydroxyphosphoribosylaminopyrimidine deaminase/5-amino-6-(5-phosphoribosylamino)uracil reductase
LDGKTALEDGTSQWISSPASRLDVQYWRARSCAIVTGIGTVMNDDPRLNVRDIDTQRQPLKVVVDSQLRIAPSAQLLHSGRTLIAYAQGNAQQVQQLASEKVELIQLGNAHGQVDLKALMRHLASLGINEVLVEAGATLNGALFEAKCVDEVIVYQAPYLLGGKAMAMLASPVLEKMSDRISLDWQDIRQIGEDIRIIARPSYHDANR